MSMLGVRYGWIIGCDANIRPEELRKLLRFHKLVVATEDEAGTYRASVMKGFVSSDCYFFVVNVIWLMFLSLLAILWWRVAIVFT